MLELEELISAPWGDTKLDLTNTLMISISDGHDQVISTLEVFHTIVYTSNIFVTCLKEDKTWQHFKLAEIRWMLKRWKRVSESAPHFVFTLVLKYFDMSLAHQTQLWWGNSHMVEDPHPKVVERKPKSYMRKQAFVKRKNTFLTFTTQPLIFSHGEHPRVRRGTHLKESIVQTSFTYKDLKVCPTYFLPPMMVGLCFRNSCYSVGYLDPFSIHCK